MKVFATDHIPKKRGYAQQNLETINQLSQKFREIQKQVAYAALLTGEMAKMAQMMEDASTARDFARAAELLQEALQLVSGDGQSALPV